MPRMRQLSYRRSSIGQLRQARQDEVVAFLSEGASYGLPGAPVERIDTHCSIVFLLDHRAYKLKRPVAF